MSELYGRVDKVPPLVAFDFPHEIVARYTEGECDFLACAINQLDHAYKICAVRATKNNNIEFIKNDEPIHYLVSYNDVLIDILGIWSAKDAIKIWHDFRIPYEIEKGYDYKLDCNYNLTDLSPDKETLEVARKILNLVTK
jgi:hypothetical protein